MKALFVGLVGSLLLRSGATYADERTKQECALAAGRGQVLRDEGKLVSADEVLGACADDACPEVVRAACGRWRDEVRARIPQVVVRVSDEHDRPVQDARIMLDGVENVALARGPSLVDPGFHSIEVQARGRRVVENVTVAERETKVVTLRLAPAQSPSPAPAASTTFPQGDSGSGEPAARSRGASVPATTRIFGGVALLSLGSFAAFGLQAQKDLEHLRDTCAPYCKEDDKNAAHSRAVVADLSLVVGVAAASVAAITYWVSQSGRSRQSSTSSSLRVSRRP